MLINKKYQPELCVDKSKRGLDHLEHPYYDAKKHRVVASDGTFIVVIPVVQPSGRVKSCWLPIPALKQARKVGRNPDMQIDIVGGKAILPDGSSIPLPKPDCDFPPYEQVIPASPCWHDDIVEVTINAKLLLELAKALGVGPTQGVTLQIRMDRIANEEEGYRGGSLNPILVIAADAQDRSAFGVIMPIRANPVPDK